MGEDDIADEGAAVVGDEESDLFGADRFLAGAVELAMGGDPGADLGVGFFGEGGDEDGAAGVICGDFLDRLDVRLDGVGGFAVEGEVDEGGACGSIIDFPEFFEFAVDLGDGDFLAEEGDI